MADYIRQMPYANPRVGYASDLIGGLLGYMKDPRRTQQLQGLAGLLESTGIPKTVERLAYGDPLTNINRANVPMLKPETAEALLTLLPAPAGANRAAKAIDPAVQKYGPKLEQTLLPAFEAAYNRGGLTREMVEAMGNQTVSPLTVYQGSPHKFAPTAKNPLGEFDPAKIGTGEGAQAFGYGHYSAEAKKLGEYYRDILSADLVDPAKRTLAKADGNVDNAIALAKTEADRLRGLNLTPETGSAKRDQLLARQESAIEQLNNYKKTGEFNTGYLYEIDLPDEAIAKMLDWDKPISQQKDVINALQSEAEARVKARLLPEIRNEISSKIPVTQQSGDWMTDLFGIGNENVRLNKLIDEQAAQELSKMDVSGLVAKELESMKPADMTWDMSGKQFYELMSKTEGDAKKASDILKNQGIPGIRYLDQSSRTNFTVQNTVKGQPYGEPVSFMTEQQAKDYAAEQVEKGFGTQIIPGTSNFVVFPGNEDLLTILKRNGGLLD